MALYNHRGRIRYPELPPQPAQGPLIPEHLLQEAAQRPGHGPGPAPGAHHEFQSGRGAHIPQAQTPASEAHRGPNQGFPFEQRPSPNHFGHPTGQATPQFAHVQQVNQGRGPVAAPDAFQRYHQNQGPLVPDHMVQQARHVPGINPQVADGPRHGRGLVPEVAQGQQHSPETRQGYHSGQGPLVPGHIPQQAAQGAGHGQVAAPEALQRYHQNQGPLIPNHQETGDGRGFAAKFVPDHDSRAVQGQGPAPDTLQGYHHNQGPLVPDQMAQNTGHGQGINLQAAERPGHGQGHAPETLQDFHLGQGPLVPDHFPQQAAQRAGHGQEPGLEALQGYHQNQEPLIPNHQATGHGPGAVQQVGEGSGHGQALTPEHAPQVAHEPEGTSETLQGSKPGQGADHLTTQRDAPEQDPDFEIIHFSLVEKRPLLLDQAAPEAFQGSQPGHPQAQIPAPPLFQGRPPACYPGQGPPAPHPPFQPHAALGTITGVAPPPELYMPPTHPIPNQMVAPGGMPPPYHMPSMQPHFYSNQAIMFPGGSRQQPPHNRVHIKKEIDSAPPQKRKYTRANSNAAATDKQTIQKLNATLRQMDGSMKNLHHELLYAIATNKAIYQDNLCLKAELNQRNQTVADLTRQLEDLHIPPHPIPAHPIPPETPPPRINIKTEPTSPDHQPSCLYSPSTSNCSPATSTPQPASVEEFGTAMEGLISREISEECSKKIVKEVFNCTPHPSSSKREIKQEMLEHEPEAMDQGYEEQQYEPNQQEVQRAQHVPMDQGEQQFQMFPQQVQHAQPFYMSQVQYPMNYQNFGQPQNFGVHVPQMSGEQETRYPTWEEALVLEPTSITIDISPEIRRVLAPVIRHYLFNRNEPQQVPQQKTKPIGYRLFQNCHKNGSAKWDKNNAELKRLWKHYADIVVECQKQQIALKMIYVGKPGAPQAPVEITIP